MRRAILEPLVLRSPAEGRALLLSTVGEDTWLADVRTWLRVGHWLDYHTHDSRRSAEGFPDVFAIHERRRWALAVELKTESGPTRPPQDMWLAAFAGLGWERLVSGVWRPRQADAVRAFLLGLSESPPPSEPTPAPRLRRRRRSVGGEGNRLGRRRVG